MHLFLIGSLLALAVGAFYLYKHFTKIETSVESDEQTIIGDVSNVFHTTEEHIDSAINLVAAAPSANV